MTGDQSLCQSLRPASPGHDGASAGCAFPSRCLSPAPASGRAVGAPALQLLQVRLAPGSLWPCPAFAFFLKQRGSRSL